MIEYDHAEKFKDHSRIDMLIVPAGTVITPVSEDAPSIPVGTAYVIDTEHLIAESFSLRESICSEENLKFGKMDSSFCTFSFVSDDTPSLLDELIDIYIYFDGDSDTLFQVGQYVVNKDRYASDRKQRNIQAYDVLQYLNDLDITDWYNEVFEDVTYISIGDLRDSLFEWLNNGNSDYPIEQEVVTLANDDFEIEKGIESDIVTFGFFMSGILEVNGVFGHIGRDGTFKYVSLEWYDQPAVKQLTNNLRFPGTQYEDYRVWGIGYVAVYDQNNIRLAKEGSSSYRYPSIYNIIDNFVFTNNHNRSGWRDDVKAAALNTRNAITHLRYYPFSADTCGDLTLEVGDRVDVEYRTDLEESVYLNSYVLSRSFSGIQSFQDSYSASGNRKQPKYQITNNRWHVGDSDNGISTSGSGAGGISIVQDDWKTKFVKAIRNIGFRLLSEPSNVSVEYDAVNLEVSIVWTDPADISNSHPSPADWAGTVVVRKEDSEPWYPWDGTILVNSTTRNEYSNAAFVDNTIEENKQYYYGIMPYDNKGDYRFTKVISVNTQKYLIAPLISNVSVSGVNITLSVSIPELPYGSYDYIKAVGKKGSIPESKTDGIVIDLNYSSTSALFENLDPGNTYYFMIFSADTDGNIANSDVEQGTTVSNDDMTFNYTGTIQTFIVPKTGVYQLETWGAQGGNAWNGSQAGRGGYGAYATGEIELAEGDVIYICVGGQNGYNGGGEKA